jgi:hypothetical protein
MPGFFAALRMTNKISHRLSDKFLILPFNLDYELQAP